MTLTSIPRTVVRVKQLQHASRRLEVVPIDPMQGRYLVASASHPGDWYHVKLDDHELTGSCTCPWSEHGGINCKHVFAALRMHYAGQGELSFWRDSTEARRQHRRMLTGDRLYATVRAPVPR